jgi:hypothetical protein
MTNAPNRYEKFVLPEGVKKITYVKDTKVPNAARFIIEREDHTAGNLLRMCAPACDVNMRSNRPEFFICSGCKGIPSSRDVYSPSVDDFVDICDTFGRFCSRVLGYIFLTVRTTPST